MAIMNAKAGWEECAVYNKVDICGVNTAKLKVLTEKEKTELLRRVREGD